MMEREGFLLAGYTMWGILSNGFGLDPADAVILSVSEGSCAQVQDPSSHAPQDDSMRGAGAHSEAY
jgi:hypothetical protein